MNWVFSKFTLVTLVSQTRYYFIYPWVVFLMHSYNKSCLRFDHKDDIILITPSWCCLHYTQAVKKRNYRSKEHATFCLNEMYVQEVNVFSTMLPEIFKTILALSLKMSKMTRYWEEDKWWLENTKLKFRSIVLVNRVIQLTL